MIAGIARIATLVGGAVVVLFVKVITVVSVTVVNKTEQTMTIKCERNIFNHYGPALSAQGKSKSLQGLCVLRVITGFLHCSASFRLFSKETDTVV